MWSVDRRTNPVDARAWEADSAACPPCRAGPSDIERGPCYLTLGLRQSCFYSLRDCAAAFKDATAYSVNPNGDNAIEGLLFWFTRVGSHLAPGLNEIPEEPVARSVAQGRVRRRDPHFGQTFVHFYEPPPTE